MTIRVAVAEDQALVRSGFVSLLRSESGLEVVGEAGDGQAAVELARAVSPDVMLMDIRMPRMDGVQATRIVTGESATRVLILTTFDADKYVHDALRAGASGFLLKDVIATDLLEAVRVVASGEAMLSPSITRRLIERYTADPESPHVDERRLGQLTPRERELLIAVARGLTNGEISQQLFISLSTTKTHISHLLEKVGARDRIQLTIFAYETGIVSRGRP